MSTGLSITRHFTKADKDPFSSFTFAYRNSRIVNPDGTVVFALDDVEVPDFWDQVAVDILASKYFRKRGVPQTDSTGQMRLTDDGEPETGPESSVKQVALRMANAWRIWGERGKYFATPADAEAFRDEMAYMLCAQMAAPNSPAWFNVGLFEAYGIIQDPDGSWFVDADSGELRESSHRYERAAVNACFISHVKDQLVGDGSIFDFAEREARLFSQGSGSGANLSDIRADGEALTAGGASSGVLSFMKVLDAAAGAIKSGGATRRAAKMVILDADHPEIESFVWCKALEEKKAAALIAAGYDGGYEGEAVRSVAFQNANHSVRITAGFMQAVVNDDDWELLARTDGSVMGKIRARDLWRQIAEAAWQCADPGLQFDDILNDWNTAADTERLRGTNPCSEYTHVDDTACNLASFNLVKFWDDDARSFDIEAFEHAVRLWTVMLEIHVSMSHYPAPIIARKSFEHRTLGLGYANLGALLMRAGLAYDSDQARAVMGAVTAVLHNRAYATSAELAVAVGPCLAWEHNQSSVARVVHNHRRAAYGSLALTRGVPNYEGLTVTPLGVDHLALAHTPFAALTPAVLQAADDALAGVDSGYRNMQVSLLAPTGCLTADTLVTTNHGLFRLGLLGDTDGPQWQDPSITNLQVLTHEGPRDVSKFYINGLADVVAVVTKSGRRLRGTPEHRVKVVDMESGQWEWRRMAEIEAGDVLPVASSLAGEERDVVLPPAAEMHHTGHDVFRDVPTHMTPELALIIGYFLGDGSLHTKGLRFSIADTDPDVEKELSSLCQDVLGISTTVEQSEGCMTMCANSTRLSRWWVDSGFGKSLPHEGHAGKGHVPVVPQAVLASNSAAVYGSFLKGLFEADGTVSDTAALSSSSRQFIGDIQTMLTSLGIQATISESTGGFSKKPVYRLTVRGGAYLPRFQHFVGFMSARKNMALDTLVSRISYNHNDNVPLSHTLLDAIVPAGHWSRPTDRALDKLRQKCLVSLSKGPGVPRSFVKDLFDMTGDSRLGLILSFFYDTVASDASFDGQALTYDLSVPNNVTYVANGLISHNTIGLVMSCDTTGVEPDFALVKLKKLAGGGYMRIVNSSLPPALRTLGYDDAAIDRILHHALGTQTLHSDVPVNAERLHQSGLSRAAIDAVERSLPNLSELSWAFAPHIVGDETFAAFGVAGGDGDDLLAALGFSPDDVVVSSKVICGHLTVEGAPDLLAEHLAVFDCAVECGDGTRVIPWAGHIKALAAVAPHLSGSVSKTVNMPNAVAVDDVADAYQMAYEMGVKCVAIYRDGSKVSQPLNSAGGSSDNTEDELVVALVAPPIGVSPTEWYNGRIPPRFRLPNLRFGPTWRIEVGGEEVYIRAGEYPDGTVGELFVDWGKQGSTLRGVTSALSITVSQALQHGVPIERIVKALRGHTFEPRGVVSGHENVKMATSIVDAIVRVLGYYYTGQEDLVQVVNPMSTRPVLHGDATPRPDLQLLAPSTVGDEVPAYDDFAVRPAQTSQSPSAAAPTPKRVFDKSCSSCGSHNLMQAGSCMVCGDCGTTTGCS